MHEISLIRNILKTLESEFPKEIQKIRVIFLNVGLTSNVQPLLMGSAFQAVLAEESAYCNTSLDVEVLPVLTLPTFFC